MEKERVNIIWFRRDLRLFDDAALYQALRSENRVLPLFIFDKNILDDLEDKADKRVQFIHQSVCEMNNVLRAMGSSFEIFHSSPLQAFQSLLEKYEVENVFANHDYELYSVTRDREIADFLQQNGAHFYTYKDQVIFDKNEVVKDDGQPYTVFTPYARKWKSTLNNFYLKSYPVEKYYGNFFQKPTSSVPSLESLGFTATAVKFPSADFNEALISNYNNTRDFPGIESGTSRLGIHLRFGTISIRQLASTSKELNETYLNELIWREFYQMIAWHFPKIGEGKAFKPAYDHIEWRNNEEEFERWCKGETGYPLVDAGMRQLNETGFMHNRVRMLTASFLTKHLLIDWRWGEAYFAQKLLDYDFASNNGGWQWAAGSGCDAAPYFRIFNPHLQLQKFDKGLAYVKRWVPEFQEFTYPKQIVDHEFARKRALEVYGKALRKQY